MSYNYTMAGALKGGVDAHDGFAGPDTDAWMTEFLPKGRIGWGGDAFNLSSSEQDASTRFTMQAAADGYAYSHNTATSIAAMLVVLAYIALATSHVLHSIFCGWSSTAWVSAPELTVLGFNSDRTKQLANIGVGASTLAPFQKPVQVRLRDERVQMTFSDTRGIGRKLVHDQKYA